MSRNEIPNGWKSVKLGKVAEIQTGIAKGKKNLKDPVRLPYLRVANVQDGYLDLSEIKEIEVEQDQVNRYLLKEGDILLTEGGDNDKLGRGTLWQGELQNCLHQNHIFVVRTNPEILLAYYLSSLTGSPYGKAYFRKASKQSTNLASINTKQLKAFPVLLPPLSEQRKIADILSTWDEAIAKTEQLITALERRKKGLMQRLLTGEVRFAGFDGAWQEVRLGDVFSERVERGYENLPLLSVTKDGIKYRDELDRRDSSSSDKSRYIRICPGDIGYNTMRMWQGRSALSSYEGIVSPAYTILKPKKSIDVRYMAYLFKFQPMIHTFYRFSQGLVSDTWSLKYPTFAKIHIKLPELGEQKRIADILELCDLEINLYTKKLSALNEQKKDLMQRLLAGQVRVKV